MYLEIDEGYFEHPKTLDLCARLEDAKACVYPLRLWKWACRSAKSGKLGKISAFAVEKAVDYDAMDGKCFAALRDSKFIDVAEDGSAEIHDWMAFTGGAISRMDAKVKSNRDRREAARRLHDAGIVPESFGSNSGKNPTKTRQDKTSPDQTSQEREIPRDPFTGMPKLRPCTATNLILCVKMAVESRPNASMWGAEPLATMNADQFLRSLGNVEKALPEIERKIALFAADPDMQPWTVKKFCEKYNGIGLPKLEYGKAPQVKPTTRSTPVKER